MSRTIELIELCAFENDAASLLDMGAGEGPFRSVVQKLGLAYSAHDFAEYVPNVSSAGLQNKSWNYTSLDFVCDILEIPETKKFDLVLLTEVLEHVPNPIEVLKKASKLLQPSGWLVFSVPMLSLEHQSPYWFQSGLSEAWFRHWFEKCGFSELEVETIGDYADLFSQEFARLLRESAKGRLARFVNGTVANFVETRVPAVIRPRLPNQLLTSGGFTVIGRMKRSPENGSFSKGVAQSNPGTKKRY